MAYIVKSFLDKKSESVEVYNKDEVEKLIKEKEAFLAEKAELSKVNAELLKENEELKKELEKKSETSKK